MDGGFIALAFGFCAVMNNYGEDAHTVGLGYLAEGKCIIRMDVGDSKGETAVINEHNIGIEILDDEETAAIVHIDDLSFSIPNTEGV